MATAQNNAGATYGNPETRRDFVKQTSPAAALVASGTAIALPALQETDACEILVLPLDLAWKVADAIYRQQHPRSSGAR
jgi:hypothetical protein